eukprot:TRINITY_DN1521_c0_g1_i1.p1 TRINITY_DN1521_c0_g1~~TRINITY_DN1521_c0_g1_i1.p1  ORF type:complete len:744 (+),score=232.96 TRINITY_DN1521_c0_g1_i1:45-2234(+)
MWGAPPVSEDEIEWEDLTTVYREQTGKIPTEKMVCNEDFELLKVMHAFEMMDPKMDAGVGYRDRKWLEEIVEGGFVKTELSEEETVLLMHYLMQAEASYLSGNVLVTNVFTCIYFHKLALVTDPFLKAYIQALCLTISSINSVILTSDVREEEEFAPLTFGVPCCEYLTMAEGIKGLEEAISAKRKEEDAAGWKIKMIELGSFRVKVLRTFQHLQDRELTKARNLTEEAKSFLKKIKTHVEDPTTPTPPIEGVIFPEARHWAISHCIGNPLPNPSYEKTIEKWENILSEHTKICTAEEVCKDLASLVTFCEEFSSAEPQPHLLSRSRLMCLLYENRLVFKKTSMVDLIVGHLTKNLGAPIFEQLLKDNTTPTNLAMLNNKGGGPEVCVANVAHLKKFLEGCQRGYLQCIYVLMHNRARLRRKLSNLFADWGLIQQLAWDCDRMVFDGDLIMDRTAPVEIAQRTVILSAFVFDTVLDIMSLFLNLGFELDLYCPSEVKEVLWYNQYIGAFQIENLRHMYKTRNITKEEIQALRKAKKLKGNQPSIPPVFATREICSPPTQQILYLEALGYALKGIVAMSHACANASLFKDQGSRDKKEKYCTPETRYEHRIQPFFQLMKPSFVRYNSYLRHNTYDRPHTEILAEAKRSFDLSLVSIRSAASTDEPKWKELEKVVRGNSVSIFLINKVIQDSLDAKKQAEEKSESVPQEQASVYYDWSYSRSLPVMKPARS